MTHFNTCTQFSPLCRVAQLKRIPFALNPGFLIKTCQSVLQVHEYTVNLSAGHSFKVVIQYLIMPRISEVRKACAI